MRTHTQSYEDTHAVCGLVSSAQRFSLSHLMSYCCRRLLAHMQHVVQLQHRIGLVHLMSYCCRLLLAHMQLYVVYFQHRIGLVHLMSYCCRLLLARHPHSFRHLALHLLFEKIKSKKNPKKKSVTPTLSDTLRCTGSMKKKKSFCKQVYAREIVLYRARQIYT